MLEENVIEGRAKILGDEHPDTIRPNDTLAGIYASQNRWDDANSLY